MRNLPEDWNSHWTTCDDHDVKYHTAECCPICDLSDEEQESWLEDRESAVEEKAEERYYNEQSPDWEPIDFF